MLLRPDQRRGSRICVDLHRNWHCHDIRRRLNRRDCFDVSPRHDASNKALINHYRAPSYGGLYHWVAEFGPKAVQRYLSYIVGWMSMIAWLTGAATLNLIAGGLIQGLAKLWYPHYSSQNWHETLIVIGIGIISTSLNTLAVKYLPLFELLSLFGHFLGIFVALFPLWIIAPKASARQVFNTFQDDGGWGSTGVACLIGQIGPLFSLLRSDGGIHICKCLILP
jgi:choline transport protein